MSKKENLNDYYLELLDWLQYEGKPSERIWHPLYHTYPWGLRFELGVYELDDTAEYVQSARDRGRRIWDAVFDQEDEVLVIFDTTPDTALKQALKTCQMQRVRAKRICRIPGEDTAEEIAAETLCFYRHLYRAAAKDIPFDAILQRIVEENTLVGGHRYGSSVYLYNRTKKLLFHPYDDRGADLIGPDRESLRPWYRALNDLLLDWNRGDMDKKWKTRPVYLRILTRDRNPGTEKSLRLTLEQIFGRTELTFSEFVPYWKIEGWGELNVCAQTPKSLEYLHKRLADHWEGDCASENIRLPNVGFLWVHE